MVTFAEFVRHVLTVAVAMGVGLGTVAWIRFRHDTAHRTFRRFAWWYGGLVVLTAVISGLSDPRTARCPRDPAELCRFNDSIPVMATIAFFYVSVALVKARWMYNER